MGKLKARTRYAIVGGDFSAQEPRLLTSLCQDKGLMENWNNNRDIYATIVHYKAYWLLGMHGTLARWLSKSYWCEDKENGEKYSTG